MSKSYSRFISERYLFDTITFEKFDRLYQEFLKYICQQFKNTTVENITVINEFFRLSYLDLKYMMDSNKKKENNKTELIQFVGVKGLNDFIYVCKNYNIPLNRENINKDLLEWKNKNNIIKAYWRKYEDFI